MPSSLKILGTERNLAARGVSEACFRRALMLVKGFNEAVCLPASFSAHSSSSAPAPPPLWQHCCTVPRPQTHCCIHLPTRPPAEHPSPDQRHLLNVPCYQPQPSRLSLHERLTADGPCHGAWEGSDGFRRNHRSRVCRQPMARPDPSRAPCSEQG